MDTSATPEPNSVTPPVEQPETWKQWLAGNAMLLLFLAAGIAFIIWKQLDVFVLLKVAVALGLVIFIHELGHFLAAKWCDVHVETFSIGFGKPIPGCRFKYGETTYKIGWIPLGGYVKMIGEGDNADTEEAEEDPRSFKNKRVGQRMLIISAGVVMNIFLACICFIVVYSHGVQENAPIVGAVESGSPAWQQGIRSGAIIEQIDDRTRPVFDDIRPIVMSTDKGDSIVLVYRMKPDGPDTTVSIVPAKDADALFPTIGVSPASQLTLANSRRPDFKPYWSGTPAASANPAFEGDDKIIASSYDPADWTKVKPIPPDERPGGAGRLDYFNFQRRMQDMRGKNMIVRIQRKHETKDITLEPAYYNTVGMRMQMGRIAACVKDSPAANAKVLSPAGEDAGVQTSKPENNETTGDKIIAVEVEETPNKVIRWDAETYNGKDRPDKKSVEVRPLDPLRIRYDLEKWADSNPGKKSVTVEVLRPTAPREQRIDTKRVTLQMEWDDTAKYNREVLSSANSPLSIPGLGLAYHVVAVVDGVVPGSSAEAAGVKKDDQIKEIRFSSIVNGQTKTGDWQPVKRLQWAMVFNMLQDASEIGLKVERAGGKEELTLKPTPDLDWPMTERGIRYQTDTQLHKANDLVEALGMGLHRTVRTVKVIYLSLYAMVFGQVSPLTMSGPLTIANVSYNIAVDDLWQFILFIGMINVNLAVINFLPIPVLDGGHMVFLGYEWVRGKPAPESVLIGAMYTGFALILALMCFVIYLDVRRLIF